MPELPEVETVKSTLEKIYLNKIIEDVDVFYDKILANLNAIEFKNKLKNQQIKALNRKGKYIIISLSYGKMLIHLRMEGKFKFDKNLLDKHSHVLFYFKDQSVLIYHDVRKFGRIYYFDSNVDIYKQAPLNKLGLEPFDASGKYLYEKIKKISRPIKSVLLDQSILAGIGNIYADEICFACKINPLKPANLIKQKKCQEIITQACKILTEAILCGGSSVKSFQSAHGVDGLFQIHLKVYGKENQPCPNCQNKIEKVFINQRGTHFCRRCQK